MHAEIIVFFNGIFTIGCSINFVHFGAAVQIPKACITVCGPGSLNQCLHCFPADGSDTNGIDVVDFPVSCVGGDCTYLTTDNSTVIIPCGKFERGLGISFTYYIKGSQQVLVNATTEYAQFSVSWNDNDVTVCCAPNTSSSDILRDSTCYQLNVTCKQQ